MAGILACHVFGCSDPVVGQCKGYKEPCGIYFCQAHSPENLCLYCYDLMWKDALEIIRVTRPQTSAATTATTTTTTPKKP